jgi:hypothetical protein
VPGRSVIRDSDGECVELADVVGADAETDGMVAGGVCVVVTVTT